MSLPSLQIHFNFHCNNFK